MQLIRLAMRDIQINVDIFHGNAGVYSVATRVGTLCSQDEGISYNI